MTPQPARAYHVALRIRLDQGELKAKNPPTTRPCLNENRQPGSFMPSLITSFPPEVMDTIHQHLMDSARLEPTTAQTPPVQPHAPLTSAQAARQAAAARANFAAVSRQFNDVDKRSLSLRQNSDVGCLVTKNTIQNLAGEPAEEFEKHLRALFQGNANIEVDFSMLSPEEAATVLSVLKETAQNDDGVPLHNVRFHADLDRASPALLGEIDAALTAIRQTENGKSASFEFACSSHDSTRTAPPDFSPLANLTSVDLSDCRRMDTAPDYSHNPELTSVNLSGCIDLETVPDFSRNPQLASVNFSGCFQLTAAPAFSENPKLTSVNLSGCFELTAPPDFSHNPNLTSVTLSWCSELATAPDFSKNPKLASVNMAECSSLADAPGFSQNPSLTSVDLSGCSLMTAAPNFSQNPKLRSVDLSECTGLAAAPVFSNNPKLTSVDLSGCTGLTAAMVEALRHLLDDRLIA